ncbi:hypothetical protein K8R78_06535 [bacterium]|nr:hypothetical protein [bacterium]
MKHSLKNTVYLLLIVGLLLTGCELFSGTATPNDNSDTGYTWAKAKALEAIESEYPGYELHFSGFETQRVDFSGHLDEALQAPYWVFYLDDEEFSRYEVYVFQYHTAVIYREYDYPDDHLRSDYTNADLRRWLGIARNAYRIVSGRRDDVSYKVRCHAGYQADGVSITLYNDNYDDVCYVRLDPITGEVEEIDFTRY